VNKLLNASVVFYRNFSKNI